jgi:hypothetical protein
MDNIFDRYTFQARLLPVFITVLPISAFIIAIFPTELTLLGTVAGVATSMGLPALLSHIGRDSGKKKESQLFATWGGVPSNLMLSYQDSTFDKNSLERYRTRIADLMNITLPSLHDEAKAYTDAMEIYQSCTNFLRERTRDTKTFALLFSENINYGFRRNLWGLKPVGITMAVLFAVACSVVLYFDLITGSPYIVSSILTAFCFLLLGLWVFIIKPEWVKVPAQAYAERLIASCENIA